VLAAASSNYNRLVASVAGAPAGSAGCRLACVWRRKPRCGPAAHA